MIKIGTIFYVNEEVSDPQLFKFKNIDFEIVDYLDDDNVIISWVDCASKQTAKVSFEISKVEYLFRNNIWIDKKKENRKKKIKKLNFILSQ